MAADPWSRPTVDDLHRVLESFERSDEFNHRDAERLELAVPAEIVTSRGNVVPAMTREISRHGLGLIHRGSLQPGTVTVKIASETREFNYQVKLEWCRPCENGMFLSGGRFIRKPASSP